MTAGGGFRTGEGVRVGNTIGRVNRKVDELWSAGEGRSVLVVGRMVVVVVVVEVVVDATSGASVVDVWASLADCLSRLSSYKKRRFNERSLAETMNRIG